MNSDFQSILNEPVIITCPKINPKRPSRQSKSTPNLNFNYSDSSSSGLNVGSDSSTGALVSSLKNSKEPNHRTKSVSDLSAESCSSFLLDYVNTRSEDISRDIGSRKQNKKDGSNEDKNSLALNGLLDKVNGLKNLLLEAIQNHQKSSSEELSQNMKFVLREMESLEREQNKLKRDEGKNRENLEEKTAENISIREQMLKIKEKCLEEKVKELYLHEKRLQQQGPSSSVGSGARDNVKVIAERAKMQDSAVNSTTSEDAPLRIVINVNQKNKSRTTKSELKWSDLIQKNAVAEGKSKELAVITKVTDESGMKYPKTPARMTKQVVTNIEQSSSSSTTVTAYLSPPEEIDTLLTKALKSTNIREQAPNARQILTTTSGAQANPQLAHYITRLLAMSRTSVNQLEVSSVSKVATPGSSIIETSTNMSGIRQLTTSTSTIAESSPETMKRPTMDERKMEQLRKFIADNHNLVQELNNTIKSATYPEPLVDGAEGVTNAEDLKRMENIWMELLSKKEHLESVPTKPIDSSQNKIFPKPVLKNRPDQQIKPTPCHSQKADLITKYDELTAHCTKRITDLDSMITKVREEKQKLLENTLSSAGSLISGFGQRENLTEYLDFPQHGQQQARPSNPNRVNLTTIMQDGDTSQGSDIKSLQTGSPEYSSSGAAAVAGIMANTSGQLGTHSKQIGISKDSGVGVSRPVTSSDFRDSPDLRGTEQQMSLNPFNKSLEQSMQQKPNQIETFEPLLKDIPKVNYRLVDPSGNINLVPSGDRQPDEGASQENKGYKLQKPPTTLAR